LPPRDARKYLFDIAQEAAQLSAFVSGKSLEDYLGDRLLQRGVQRQFEIIGEALSQMSKLDPHWPSAFRTIKKSSRSEISSSMDMLMLKTSSYGISLKRDYQLFVGK
jgi:hypothetical protein